jgi:hypothetical protein
MDRDLIAPLPRRSCQAEAGGPDLHWHVSKLIAPRRSNGERELAELSGKFLLLPQDEAFHTYAEGLSWRRERLTA